MSFVYPGRSRFSVLSTPLSHLTCAVTRVLSLCLRVGKVFTLFYVPFSVVSVAGLINHVAAVPLETRRENLEKYVLAQFADHVTQGDFDDIRRSAAISDDRSIRANDFLIAMALRLGYLNPVRPLHRAVQQCECAPAFN